MTPISPDTAPPSSLGSDPLRTVTEPDQSGGSKTDPTIGTWDPQTVPQSPASQRVAGYEIVEVLGRGGMGVVYKARQTSLNRLVALKMLVAGSHAGPDLLARFHAEAEAVAHLEHPNIVHIYDVGQTEGLPYLALEFVAGSTLARKLEGKPQPADEAARMVLTLARAMHFAHQRGILHRDLKPANILLRRKSEISNPKSETGQVKVSDFGFRISDFEPMITDFGLAKQLGAGERLTRTGEVMGTPSYMAPEQGAGTTREIGPAVDVYALGAILYEMLTGRPPFLAESPVETVMQVLGQEPVPPRRLREKVPADLETICLKCLEKKPGKRYGSAGELAADLDRYLHGQPIMARPTPRWERVVKWAKRRPAMAALISVSVVAIVSLLVGFAVYSARLDAYNTRLDAEKQTAEKQRERADKRLVKAMAALDRLTQVSEGEEELANEPHMEALRRKLLEDALKFYEELLREEEADPELRYETGRAYFRAGGIRLAQGKQEEAKAAFDQAIVLFQTLAEQHPEKPVYRKDLANSCQRLGDTLRDLDRLTDADKAYHQALDLQNELVQEFPDERDYRHDYAMSFNELGNLLYDALRRSDEGKKAHQEALALREKLAADFPEVPEYQKDLSQSYHNVAWGLHDAGKYGEAEKIYNKAVAIRQKLADEFPKKAVYRQFLGRTLNNLGGCLRGAGQFDRAEEVLGKVVALREKLTTEFPRVTRYWEELGDIHNHLGLFYEQKKEFSKSLQAHQEALKIREKLAQENPSVPLFARTVVDSYSNVGLINLRQQSYAAAIAACNQALRLNPKHKWAYNNRGLAYYRSKEYAKAIEDFDAAIQLDSSYDLPYWNRGLAYRELKDYARSIEDLSKAIELKPKAILYKERAGTFHLMEEYAKVVEDLTKALGLDRSDAATWLDRAIAYYHLGENDKAATDCNVALLLDPKNARALAARGYLHMKKGVFDKAVKDMDEAVRLDPKFGLGFAFRAWLWATCPDAGRRDGKKALEYATKACELTQWQSPHCLEALAAAYAETGDFTEAVKRQQKALALPGLSKAEKMEATKRLALYQANKPFREKSQQ
jgi:serine/threonine protein kinase/tetratricopeptide (TPR) repeat protein